MKRSNRSKSGQTMVEYIIVVVIIALAAIAIFGVFGDTIRAKMGGAVTELSSDSATVTSVTDANATKSEQFLKDL